MNAEKTRILIIDDEEPIRMLLTDLLEMHGYEVIAATNGIDGLRKTFSEAPRIVITDILMPEMTGLAFLQRVRAQVPASALPVIVVSALGLQEQIVKAFEAGATDYLVKPFHHSELLARIHIALHRTVDSQDVQYVEREVPARPKTELIPGGVLDLGKYCILEELGSGGMGTVYRATHMAYGSEVAVKVLSPKLAKNRSDVMRFLREVRIATQMDHPNIVKVYDMGLSAGQYYYAMESLPRHSLYDEVTRLQDGLEEDRVLGIGIQLASALAYMHERGFLHRDVKPDNILFASPDCVKLVDFGLACAVEDARLTQKGTFMGTPGYVAPENIREYHAPDAPADIYSLGATLYLAAAGRSAFSHKKGATARLAAQIVENPPALNQTNPRISTSFAGIIAKMMARDPARRYGTMREVHAALLRHQQSLREARAAAPTDNNG
jgi:CheY-like chemotaxis protein